MGRLKVSDAEIRDIYNAMQELDDTVTADRILCNPLYREAFLNRLDISDDEVEEATLRRLINLRKSKKLEPGK